MINRLQGKTAFITGASSGIGYACAENLAALGVHLILVARRLSRLEQLQKKIKKHYPHLLVQIKKLDVCNRRAVLHYVKTLIRQHCIPDIVINNAGLAAGLAPLQEGDFTDWDRMIDTNVKGLLNISRALIPLMIKRRRGHIINLGSIAGHEVYPRGNVYNATKFAVRALTEGMNIDLVTTPIKVSSIDPGMVETEFSLVRFHGDKKRAAKVYQALVPLGAQDIAEAVVFMLNTDRKSVV